MCVYVKIADNYKKISTVSSPTIILFHVHGYFSFAKYSYTYVSSLNKLFLQPCPGTRPLWTIFDNTGIFYLKESIRSIAIMLSLSPCNKKKPFDFWSFSVKPKHRMGSDFKLATCNLLNTRIGQRISTVWLGQLQFTLRYDSLLAHSRSTVGGFL